MIAESIKELSGVFANMFDPATGQATEAVSRMVCDREDFDHFCTRNINAYTRADTGRFHICDKGMAKPRNSDIACDTLDASCSKKMRSLSMVLLHETTHFDDIGAAAHGRIGIIDLARGAYDCFKLSREDKSDNAQNYAWLSGEAYWSDFCSKTFEDPKPGVQ
jgi:hypothetical protein